MRVYKNALKDCLHSLDCEEATDHAYDRGLVVGIVSALMWRGASFDVAIGHVKNNLPSEYDVESLPHNWRQYFQEGDA